MKRLFIALLIGINLLFAAQAVKAEDIAQVAPADVEVKTDEKEKAAEEAKKAQDAAKRKANTVLLDEIGVKNLRIETVIAEETTFEQTVFALGRIEVLPGKKAIVSSRIEGRAFSVLALPDQEVDEGEEMLWVESRQPGNPPPTIMLPAPMAGTVAKVDIAVGQPITADQSLIEIVDLSTVEAEAHVPEHLAGKLAKDQMAHIRVSGFPDQVFEAKLAHLGAYADGDSGTVEAAFHVANPDKLLRPGMRAEFNIVVGKRENVLSVPRKALLGEPAQRFVYVKDSDKKLKGAYLKCPVVVGENNGQNVEILSGLLPDDEVVTRGGYSLSFAGASSISLKEALDAAHGHEHAADGSELTPEKKAEMASEKAGAGGHDHDHGHAHAEEKGGNPLWMYASIVLFILLLASLFTKKRGDAEAGCSPAKPTKKGVA